MPEGGVRELNVLSDFKPFGLAAEALDGGTPSDSDYHYFLFDPQVAKQRDGTDDDSATSTERGDHEIFVRGNRIIWSTGARVYRRLTLPSKVVKVCWCRMGGTSEALLCVLQVDSLTIYGVAGEVVSVPLPYAVTSIWPIPFGLLLQRAPEGNLLTNISLSTSNQLLNAFRSKSDARYSPQNNFAPVFDLSARKDGTSISSHMILKDPLEEPQITYIEERGKINLMWEFEERTIWTSDYVPLMASYNKGKMQHSLWVVEISNSSLDVANYKSSDSMAPGMSVNHFFRRIWHVKGSQTAASKVFLATENDATPIICFLLQEQKKLLSLRLQSLEINNEIVYDIKPDMSWSISAIAAAAVTVTRPKEKVGQFPLKDIIVLAPDNTLLLYSGKLCLCKYLLPSSWVKEQLLSRVGFSQINNSMHDLKIVDLVDAVEGRINLILNNGQICRCTLRRSPSSCLADDCITAMAEGLSVSLYSHFLGLLWGGDDSTYIVQANSSADSEWESFCNVITKICGKCTTTSSMSDSRTDSSWGFLMQSSYHKQYVRTNYIAAAFTGLSSKLHRFDGSGSVVADKQNTEETVYLQLLTQTLDSLHAVYETLKLDNLRRRDLGLLVILLCDIADFLHEVNYLDHYKRDFPRIAKDFQISECLVTPRNPPSLFRWLENCLLHGYGVANTSDLPLLICKDGNSVVNWARKIVSFYSLLCGADHSNNKLTSGITFSIGPGPYRSREELTVLAMVGENFGLQHLDLLPPGVALPLRHAIDNCRESPPTNWPSAAYVLLGREDLALLHLRDPTKAAKLDITNSNLISVSTPYMLPVHPVTIPSSFSDTLDMDGTKLEDIDTFEGYVADGMEHIFNSSTQLRYGCDLRLNEVRRLL